MAAKLPIQDMPFIPALGMAPRNYESKTLTQERLDALIARHSIDDAFEAWAKDFASVRERGPLVVNHRLLSSWANGQADNSNAGIKNMKDAGFKLGERDPMRTADGAFITSHPGTTDRLLKGPGMKIGAVAFKDLEGKELIVPQVSQGRFTGEMHPTGEFMTSLAAQLPAVLESYPGYCEVEDIRNADIAPFFEYAYEHFKDHLKRLLIQSYPYIFKSFDQVRQKVNLPLGWQQFFNAGVAVTAETLIAMAFERTAQEEASGQATSVSALEKVCFDYIDGWYAQTWLTFAVNLGINEAGEWLHANEESATHPDGHIFTDPGILLKIRAIKALNNVCRSLLTEKPDIMRLATARTCDYVDLKTKEKYFFSMVDGQPSKWPAEGTEARYLFEAAADIGFMIENADAVMVDQPIEFFEIVDQRSKLT